MEMDIKERLIELVRQYECIYNIKHKDYKNVNYKNLLWEKIGASIGVQGSKAKDTWRTLRDGYMRHKKTVKGKTGSSRKYSNYTWSSHLTFLDDSLELRPTGTNIIQDNAELPESPLPGQALSPQLSPATPSSQSQSPSRNDNNDTGLETTLRYLDVLTNRPSCSTVPPLLSPPSPQTQQPPSQPSTSVSLPSPSPRTTKRRNESDTVLDGTDKVLDYLRNKKKREWDSVDHLFMSYAKTFKTLPVGRQCKIKVELAKLFADAELEHTSNTTDEIQSESSQVIYLSSAYSVISEDLNDQTQAIIMENTPQQEPTSAGQEDNEAVDLSNYRYSD